MSSLREQFLSAAFPAPEPVEVPELGATVWVKSLTAAQRDDFDASLRRKNARGGFDVETRDMRAKLVALTACSEDGRLLFGPDDVPALSKLPAAVIDRVFAVASRVNRMGNEDTQELAEKNGKTPAAIASSSN